MRFFAEDSHALAQPRQLTRPLTETRHLLTPIHRRCRTVFSELSFILLTVSQRRAGASRSPLAGLNSCAFHFMFSLLEGRNHPNQSATETSSYEIVATTCPDVMHTMAQATSSTRRQGGGGEGGQQKEKLRSFTQTRRHTEKKFFGRTTNTEASPHAKNSTHHQHSSSHVSAFDCCRHSLEGKTERLD